MNKIPFCTRRQVSQCTVCTSHHFLQILILYIHRQHQLRREKFAVFNKILTSLSLTRQDMAIKLYYIMRIILGEQPATLTTTYVPK